MTALDRSRLDAPGFPLRADGTDHVVVALAAFNGADVIGEQLNSFARQSHRNWSLIVSDDGSTDATLAAVRAFAAGTPAHRVTVLRGPGKGSAQNFLSLLRAAGPAPFVAFSDQDDVWFPDKLERAVAALDRCDGPAIYGSRTQIVDAALAPRGLSMAFRRPCGFGNALVQNVAGGNTMVLNRPALDVLQPASLAARSIVAHDWWAYQMVTGCGGALILDPEPSLSYRQHPANQIGANGGLRATCARLRGLTDGTFARWMDANLDALEAAGDWLTPEARGRVALLRRARAAPLVERLGLVRRAGVYRQSRRGSLALWIAALSGRL